MSWAHGLLLIAVLRFHFGGYPVAFAPRFLRRHRNQTMRQRPSPFLEYVADLLKALMNIMNALAGDLRQVHIEIKIQIDGLVEVAPAGFALSKGGSMLKRTSRASEGPRLDQATTAAALSTNN